MLKVLFFIPNLMHGGAEKVLVNLVNNLDKSKYDITLQTIFDEGVNKKYLNNNIRYKYVFKKLFRGSTTIFKLFRPEFLYKKIIEDKYDIAISYLEGPTARIMSGCPYDSKIITWIHTTMNDKKVFSSGFRNYNESKKCYEKFNKIVCVSNSVKKNFIEISELYSKDIAVLYNTNETDYILERSNEYVKDIDFDKDIINVCSVGKIIGIKGYDRLARVHKRLIYEGLKHHIYILGIGEDQGKIEKYLKDNKLDDTFTFIGFRDNPYKYVAKCDLYVCSSLREGFSTAVTESLIVGTPVVSTLCSGAYELLGKNNKYGIVVENSEEGIYQGLKEMIANKDRLKYYEDKSKERGKLFSKEKTVSKIEELLDYL